MACSGLYNNNDVCYPFLSREHLGTIIRAHASYGTYNVQHLMVHHFITGNLQMIIMGLQELIRSLYMTNMGDFEDISDQCGVCMNQFGVCRSQCRGCRDQYWDCRDQCGDCRDQYGACRLPIWGL